MGKSRKDYEKFLNSISPDRDDETRIIGGKNRYCGRENYGTMIKRYDPIGFTVVMTQEHFPESVQILFFISVMIKLK